MSQTMVNARLQALEILQALFIDRRRLDLLFQGNKDLTPFAKAICFGLCRHYFQLELIADSLLDKRPKEPDLWLLLLMGLYQLQFLNKPEYATVQETVALVTKIKKPWAKGLVNAILRRFCREKEAILKNLEKEKAFAANHPAWFISRIEKEWPQHWKAILEGNDAQAPMSLRVNELRVGRDSYLQRLQDTGQNASPLAFAPSGILLENAVDVNELPGFAEGDVSVQDWAAQLAAPLLALGPGQRVLDVCAAPGGKACHMLELEPQLGPCLALDLDERRLARIHDNVTRLHLKPRVRVLQGDALQPQSWWDGQAFDRILLDAPCSATGVIRRHPDIKILRTEAEVEKSSALQAELLQSIWPLLKTGGMMLYATCSVLKEENEEQIAKFMATHPDCKVLQSEQPWGLNTGFGWQLFPGDNNGDGFFYSILIRD